METSAEAFATPPELVAAWRANDAPTVARILVERPDLRARINEPMQGGSFGATPLICAVQRRSRELVDVLLQAGADINARSHWWAGSFGVLDHDTGLAEFLIERGARVDPNAAAKHGLHDRLLAMVEADPATVHARGGDGQTPLHVARNVDIARLLVDHGADIDALDVDHESTPAQYLIRDHPEVSRFLVDRGCRTDLLLAAALGDLGLARRHLDADPDCIRLRVDERCFPMKNPQAGGIIYIWTLGQNKTAHMVASDRGHREMLELLLSRTPPSLRLALAGETADEETLREFIALHPRFPNDLTPDERRSLVNAAQSENLRALRIMLEAGWPVDARGQHGGTALHWAAFHGHAAMVELLLARNPPLELEDDSFGGTPMGWAVHGSENGWGRPASDYGAVVEALLRAGAKPPERVAGTEAVRAVLRRHGVTG